ncbi:N-6 DNA methylase [Deinococcus saxicola]|uniref:N-6 DNA methylase n=1 Tax=Deinococcus saxicola TaxID=249406 RepID=UPI003D0C241C
MTPAQARAAFTEYVKAIRKAHGKGTPENTYLPLLKPLFEGLLPEYHVITHPSKDAQGLPDFALREPDGAENLVIGEAEALDVPLSKNKHGWEQARGYAKQAPTLLTNFHEFVVLDGETELGRYTIPHAELTGTAKPAALADAHLENLSGLLSVWASARSPLTRPQKIAGLLAFYARQALAKLEQQDEDALAPLRKAMEDALGTSFTLPRPDGSRKRSADQQRRDEEKWAEKQAELSHFFRSSLVQALFYGLFSGWVMAARAGRGEAVTRENIADYLHIPVITLLLDEVNTSRKLAKLDLKEPVERAVDILRRVAAEPFLASFENGEAVTYFYEPFLDAFDPGLREQLGVWYTPREIIQYQIRHVHGLLQTQLGIEGGLLDPRVTILDPATGTGGYLLELGQFMHGELQRRGTSRIGARLKDAFLSRIYGFELLPAPFAIVHLQLALMLAGWGAPLGKDAAGHDERFNVLLTNSLNGWTPRTDKPEPLFAELADELTRTEGVKQGRQIMVMLGNPPYARFADMPDNPEEQALIAPYKHCLRESWGVKKQLLDDLYIRFLRLAEWRVAGTGQEGIVSFVTNRSYLTGISHPVMRQHLLGSFDQIYIDDLHGNQRANKAGDGSVFTTATNGGIRVGVAIGTFVKKAAVKGVEAESGEPAQVHYREFYGSGARKRAALTEDATPYAPAFTPRREHRYVLRPLQGEDAYWDWPTIDELFPVGFDGINTNLDAHLINIKLGSLTTKMERYFHKETSSEELSEEYPGITADLGYKNLKNIREQLLKMGGGGVRSQKDSALCLSSVR